MIDSCSKRSLPDWYSAVQSIRPVDLDALSSQRLWEKWDRVKKKDVDRITSRFFGRIIGQTAPGSGCFFRSFPRF
jgi:hypothetical protein